jgi:regulator of sirC expression with transglutaminase-like and TPR domain
VPPCSRCYGYGRVLDPTARFVEIVTSADAERRLDEAALLIAAHAHPELDVELRLAQLDGLATASSARDADELAAYLFGAEHFAGNTADYGDPRNSYLDDVLDRRLGIPISLSVLMVTVGRRLGIELHGVGMPGHFLVGGAPGEWYDPFHQGARLDAMGCAVRFAESQGLAEFRPEYLAPTPPDRILDRMLANLQHTFLQRDPASAAWVLRLRARIPGTTRSQRAQLAELLGSIGQFSDAARELDQLATELPGEAGAQAAAAAARLRARAN